MMLKIVLIVFSFLLIESPLLAFDFNTDNFCANYIFGEYIIATNSKLIHVSEIEGKILSEMKRPNKIVNKYGYAYIKMPTAECYLIDFWGWLISVKNDYERNYSEENESFEVPSNIRASSEFSENNNGNTIVYDSRNPFNRLDYQKEAGYLFGYYRLPWIPDIKHDKTPYLEFHMNKETELFSILSGYIDFDRQYLFWDNSRPREISVIDLEKNTNIGNYVLDDGMKYNIVQLKYKVKDIKIVFHDFYKGNKYDDPCISSIVILDNNLKSDYGKSMIGNLKKIIKGSD